MRKTKEQGITLVALIITIIVLVILAAVTINAAFNIGIIDTAVNGAVNYADAQNKEKISFEDLDKDIQDIVNKIENYGGSGEEQKLSISTPTVVRVDNSTSELRVTATAEDEDEHDTLIYTLLRGTSEDDTNPTELSLEPENIEGRTVTFKDMGLEMAQTYYYKIKVSNGKVNFTSASYGRERTWCKAEHCDGGYYEYEDCPECERSEDYHVAIQLAIMVKLNAQTARELERTIRKRLVQLVLLVTDGVKRIGMVEQTGTIPLGEATYICKVCKKSCLHYYDTYKQRT